MKRLLPILLLLIVSLSASAERVRVRLYFTNDITTLNVSYIGERPYPWVNIIGAVVCIIGIIGILYGMRQV